MSTVESAVAVYHTHFEAEQAVKELQQAGTDMHILSIVAKDSRYFGQYICSKVTAIFGLSALLLLGGTLALGQAADSAAPAQDAMMDPADQNRQLTDQIAALRAQVAELQAAVHQSGQQRKIVTHSGMKMSPGPNKGMAMMKEGKGEMGMPSADGAMTSATASMKQGEGEMSGMPMAGNSAAPPAADAAMGMCCGNKASGGKAAMGGMPPAPRGMGTMATPSSATPGQAGVSHLYHMGSSGFFLNQSRHITLTQDQRLTLTHAKETAMLERASEQRAIDLREQEMYTLTAAEQPDNFKIQAQIAEIEKLRGTQRMNFIRAVEEASNVLTPEQREVLLRTTAARQR